MGLTGKFKFRKTLWGKIVLQLEEEVKPFWSRSKPAHLKQRWRSPHFAHSLGNKGPASPLAGPFA